MENSRELKFESPDFCRRLRGMLGVDFYRLFHTPMFYIFLAVAAIIPAMILGMGGGGTQGDAPMYTNTWQIIAAQTPLYVVSNMGEYANMNMVFIFGGIMVSIFIGHDYKSGYVKQLFTAHAKKQDYMMSKSIAGAFSMACMCVTYLIGAVVAGMLTGTSFDINIGSLVLAVLSKMVMGFGWASLYTFLNTIFRRYFGISIASSFFLGTGVLVIGAAAAAGGIMKCLLSKVLLMAVFVPIYLFMSVMAKQKTWMAMVFSFFVGMLFFMMIPMLTPLNAGIINVIGCLAGGVLFSLGFGAASRQVLARTSLV